MTQSRVFFSSLNSSDEKNCFPHRSIKTSRYAVSSYCVCVSCRVLFVEKNVRQLNPAIVAVSASISLRYDLILTNPGDIIVFLVLSHRLSSFRQKMEKWKNGKTETVKKREKNGWKGEKKH